MSWSLGRQGPKCAAVSWSFILRDDEEGAEGQGANPEDGRWTQCHIPGQTTAVAPMANASDILVNEGYAVNSNTMNTANSVYKQYIYHFKYLRQLSKQLSSICLFPSRHGVKTLHTQDSMYVYIMYVCQEHMFTYTRGGSRLGVFYFIFLVIMMQSYK